MVLVTEPYDGTSSRVERVSSFQAQIAQRSLLSGAVLATGDNLTGALQSFLHKEGAGTKALFCANGVAALACVKALREIGCRLLQFPSRFLLLDPTVAKETERETTALNFFFFFPSAKKSGTPAFSRHFSRVNSIIYPKAFS